MDKISYLRLFLVYTDAITSNSVLGSELRQMINLDVIWNKLSDDERQEMTNFFTEMANNVSREILHKRNKSLKSFKKGLRKK